MGQKTESKKNIESPLPLWGLTYVGVRRDGAAELALSSEGGEDFAEGGRRPDESGPQRHKVR